MTRHQFTIIIEREGRSYVSHCPELGVSSQGRSVESARKNLREAVELFLECASPEEIANRRHEEVYVSRFEVTHA